MINQLHGSLRIYLSLLKILCTMLSLWNTMDTEMELHDMDETHCVALELLLMLELDYRPIKFLWLHFPSCMNCTSICWDFVRVQYSCNWNDNWQFWIIDNHAKANVMRTLLTHSPLWLATVGSSMCMAFSTHRQWIASFHPNTNMNIHCANVHFPNS